MSTARGERPRRTSPRDSDDEVLGKAYDARLMARVWEVTRPHGRLVLGSLILFPLVALLELLQPYLVKTAIDQHILRRDWVGLGHVASIFLVVLLVLYALRMAQAYLTQLTGQRVMYDLRNALFTHLERLDAPFFDRNPVGRLMTRVLNDVEAINELFTSGVVSILGDVLTVVGVVIIMLGMNWELALVTFSLVPLLVVASMYFRLRARESYRRVRTRLARLNAFLQESLQGMSVIQLFAREGRERALFAGLNADLRHAQFRSTVYDGSLYATVETLGSAAVALLLWYGGGEVVRGALTFGGLVAFLEYTHRFFLPIRDLGAKYAVMQAAVVSSERIFGLLDTEPSIRSNGAAVTAPVADRRTPAVEFRNVWFAYHDDEWVLRDCSLTVERGEQVALVGPTGEGKTTIARLITRVYEASRGQVLVEGRDVRDWDLRELRRHVGLIPQEVFLFSGTVEANLRLGSDGAVTNAELRNAIVAANATRLIEALPSGLAEEIRERGANLSHGQRQLLAIARALIYNPRVLALDEAMSSVDPESEALIREALARLLTGRTSVVIAHRLSTIQRADRILVLHKGRVRESGRHAELLAQHGLYSWLYELQFGLVRS
ncbi:MAG TPA: ABC transporter ATP-binding protein [Candidatus Methylomirabilis sp.]|nr:ABC transporter ATP-binding protein [Candidatus Methylomirabilis sp.]